MSEMLISIDRRKTMVQVYDPDRGQPEIPVRFFRCALGIKGFRTPKGPWVLGNRSREPDWKAPIWAAALGLKPGKIYEFGEPGNPYRAGLIDLVWVGRKRKKDMTGYAIHGTTNPGSIPGYGSHGCVRVYDEDLFWLYDNCPAGTPVRIY